MHTIMKKTYITPITSVYCIESKTVLLAGSADLEQTLTPEDIVSPEDFLPGGTGLPPFIQL